MFFFNFKKYPKIYYFAISLALILSLAVFIIVIRAFSPESFKFRSNNTSSDARAYHVLVLGTSENQLFMQKVYEGAKNLSNKYNAVVELYVPESIAKDKQVQELCEYAEFVNADGIIAFIDSPEIKLNQLHRFDNTLIPLVTTGIFSSEVSQITFIGNNYWELGKNIGREICSVLKDGGTAYVIMGNGTQESSSINFGNLLNSLQTELYKKSGISYEEVNEAEIRNLVKEFKGLNPKEKEKKLLVCLTEQDTIRTVQTLTDLSEDKKLKIIGFGSNETCQLFLEKAYLTELISLDTEKIGHSALQEIFEFRNKGYANSYIAADIKIQKVNK